MIFVGGVEECRASYADKKGKYQDKSGISLPFVMNTPNGADVAKIPKAPSARPAKKKR